MVKVVFTIPMDYPGWSISKNGLWNGGNRRFGMNKEARRWKDDLAAAVRSYLQLNGILVPQAPVHVEVGARFYDRTMALDLHNLSEIVCDAVQDGIGIDDKHFTFSTREPEFAHMMPEIRVSISLGSK